MDEKLQSSTSRREVLKFASGLAAGGAAGIVASGAPFAVEGALAAPRQAPGDVLVLIGANALPAVQSVDLLESETDVTSYTDGGDIVTHFRPGRQKPGKIVITREWHNSGELLDWYNAVIAGESSGKTDRKSISIIFHNDAGEELSRINLYQCWPSKWTMPDLNARNSGHASEKIEIVFETMELKAK